jgi:hypothetical protein
MYEHEISIIMIQARIVTVTVLYNHHDFVYSIVIRVPGPVTLTPVHWQVSVQMHRDLHTVTASGALTVYGDCRRPGARALTRNLKFESPSPESVRCAPFEASAAAA